MQQPASVTSDDPLARAPGGRARRAATRAWSAAAALVALLVLAGAAAGGEPAVTQLTGKVNAVLPMAKGVADELAALGVVVGADVQVEVSVDPGAPLDESHPGLALYKPAVVDFTVTIGEYQAVFDAPKDDVLNAVAVANDFSDGGLTVDKYTVNALGLDAGVLSSLEPAPHLQFKLDFNDITATAISDLDVVQDVHAFPFGLGQLATLRGQVLFLIGDPGGGGSFPGADPSSFARRGQLKAASKLVKKVLATKGGFAGKPASADPLGEKEQAALSKARAAFVKEFVKSVEKALAKGGTAPLPARSADDAAALLLGGAEAFAATIPGAHSPDKPERALAGKLLKLAAARTGKDLAAHAQHVFSPNPGKLAKKLGGSAAAFEKKTDKAIAGAVKKGVPYAGPTPQQMAAFLDTMVEGFVAETGGGG